MKKDILPHSKRRGVGATIHYILGAMHAVAISMEAAKDLLFHPHNRSYILLKCFVFLPQFPCR